MSSHRLLPSLSNPFLGHRLEGWEPHHPHIHFPVTFSVHREGRNIGLYLAPMGFSTLRFGLGLPTDDMALVIDERGQARVLPWGSVSRLSGEAEIIHLPASADMEEVMEQLPQPLLSEPERAVPSRFGSQVAVSVYDGCHGTVISPDVTILSACLRAFIEDYQVTVLGRDAVLPRLNDRTLEPLLQPVEPGCWYGLRLVTRQRFWIMEIEENRGETHQTLRQFVSEGEGGNWRAGWSW